MVIIDYIPGNSDLITLSLSLCAGIVLFWATSIYARSAFQKVISISPLLFFAVTFSLFIDAIIGSLDSLSGISSSYGLVVVNAIPHLALLPCLVPLCFTMVGMVRGKLSISPTTNAHLILPGLVFFELILTISPHFPATLFLYATIQFSFWILIALFLFLKIQHEQGGEDTSLYLGLAVYWLYRFADGINTHMHCSNCSASFIILNGTIVAVLAFTFVWWYAASMNRRIVYRP